MNYTAELIAVGTELLLGNIANTDAQMLSRELSALGINVYYHTVVGDNPERVAEAVAVARGRANIIITTGGLGPTCDDLTKQALAAAFDKKMVYDEASADKIRSYFKELGREMTENNLQQALLPEDCTILVNDWGTAPGCAFESKGCHVIMLPGPPKECAAMFRYRALPYLQTLSNGMIVSRTLRVFGIGESSLESLLRTEMNALTNPTLAPYAKAGEVELRITAKADDEETAQQLIAPVEAQVRQILGNKIYGADVESLEEVCFSLLKEKHLTISTAESCTGGLIAKRLTDLAGSSVVFKGSAVTYANSAKSKILGVSDTLLKKYGAVSKEVAEAMAIGAKAVFETDLAIAVTGVAGPDPDADGNPVGLVYIALANCEGCTVKKLDAGKISRERVRTWAANYSLDFVRRYLTDALHNT
ncbi:MAG: competence/damage-inducible protein A [Evtepia sp.]